MGISKGMVWGALKKEEQTELLSKVNIWEEIRNVKVGDKIESIIDLTDTLSICATVEIGEDENEIIIKDLAVIYNSTEGIISLQELYNNWRKQYEDLKEEDYKYNLDCEQSNVREDFSDYLDLKDDIISYNEMLKLEMWFDENN